MTTARAIETRCCSPPESSSGKRGHLVGEPDEREHLGHLAADVRRALALHLERVGDVLGRRAVAQELEVLEDAADVAAQQRHLRVLEPGQVAAADEDPARARLELLQEQADHRRLAGAGGADDEDELALLDHEGDVVERDDVRVVDLGHALEHDHRPRDRGFDGHAVLRLDGHGLGHGFVHVCLHVEISHRNREGGRPHVGRSGICGSPSLANRSVRRPSRRPSASRYSRTKPSRLPSRTPWALPTS